MVNFFNGMNRRQFLASAAAAGAGAVLASNLGRVLGQTASAPAATTQKVDPLNVAIIGVGQQGLILLRDCLAIPGIRFKAVCDIWPYRQNYGSAVVKKSGQEKPKVYVDYKEMLDAEKKDLQAVIVASPDWMHAEHSCAAMEAGLDVYCEKEMSNTIEGARQMVLTARKTGKKLQIGHQRRSSPGYRHALKMIEKDNVCGRITNCFGQWNRAAQEQAAVPDNMAVPKDVLEKYGYDTMAKFQNWRWYKKFAGGPIVDLGSHQIDIFNWILGANPSAVMASGGCDYYKDGREWYDSVMAIYEYNTPKGCARAFYQVLNTTSFGAYYETFMGDRGTINLSEDVKKCFYVPEPSKEKPVWVNQADIIEKSGVGGAIALDSDASRKKMTKQGTTVGTATSAPVEKPLHTWHLENFFDAIRKGVPLNCPAEESFQTAVTVLKVNEAVAAGKKLEFKPEDFKV